MYHDDNYLIHYGVKGMKWGVRHDKVSSGVRKAGKAAKTAATYTFGPTRYTKGRKMLKQKKYEKSDYAAAKKMSDAELRARINRINLEQSYISAMERDRASSKAASQLVIEKHGSKAIKYATGIPNNKEFKKSVAKKAAKTLL